MDWRDVIYSNPNIYGGKPIFRDSRITVEMVLDLMAAGWTIGQMAEEYPGIRPDHIPAAAAFAAEMIHDEQRLASSRARAA
ncbi:MAG: DUF433 domain-containing protein [Janthinobacterium lividum]